MCDGGNLSIATAILALAAGMFVAAKIAAAHTSRSARLIAFTAGIVTIHAGVLLVLITIALRCMN